MCNFVIALYIRHLFLRNLIVFWRHTWVMKLYFRN